MSDWEKIEPEEQEDEIWNFEEDMLLEGVLTGVQEGIGPHNSTLYEAKVDGKKVKFWGSTIIDTRLRNVKIGEEIKIQYKGEKKSAKTGRKYKDYVVWHRESENNPAEDAMPNGTTPPPPDDEDTPSF